MPRCLKLLALLAALAVPVTGRSQTDGLNLARPIVISTTPYNLHVVVTEDFLNRFVAREEAEPGRVDDFVFGAKVDGEQWTARSLRLDLRPSSDKAHAAFVLRGQVQSVTVGRTEQGAVQSVGRQEFEAEKDVFFDGWEISTRHATVKARASNQAVAASTRLDGTFLERLGQKIALSRAEQQRPQTEAYARDKVAERVYPAFDGNVDAQLAKANQQLTEQLFARLRQVELLPTTQRSQSTDTHLHHAVRLAMADQADQIPAPTSSLAGAHGMTLYVHEGLFNSLIDRLALRGKSTTDRELKSIFDRAGGLLGGRATPGEREPVERRSPPGLGGGLETKIEFDAMAPLTLRLLEGRLQVEIRATFKPAGQALLPPLLITIPMRLENLGEEWQLTRGSIGIQATNGQQLPAVAENLIRQAIESNVQPARFPRTLPIPDWPADKPRLVFSDVRAADGWLAISLD